MHFKETKHTKCKLTNSASADIGQPTYLLMEKLWQFIVLKCKTVYTQQYLLQNGRSEKASKYYSI